MKMTTWVVLVLAAGCAASPDEQAESSALDTTNPGARIGTPFTGAPMNWHWTDPGPDSDRTRCHDCSTTPSTDPATEVASSPGSLAAFASAIPPWRGTAPLATFVAAAYDGDTVVATTSSSNVSDALAGVKRDFDAIIAATGGTGTATPSEPETKTWVVGFPAVQGRELQLEYLREGGFDIPHSYDLAAGFSELRMRGAKQFCAARAAAFEMDARKDSGYALYDHQKSEFLYWKTGVTGASLRLLPSTAHQDRQSEAFSIPLELSSRLAPLAGPAMPSFGELVHPLAWLTGDREISSFEDYGPIHIGICRSAPFGGTFCVGADVNTYRKIARNLEHDDAMSGTSFKQTLTIGGIQIINWGLFSLHAGGEIDVETGKVDETSFAEATGRVEMFGPFAALPPRAATLDDLLTPPSYAADAPLALNGPFVAFGGSSNIHDAPTSPATITRWRNDDDRAITVTDKVTESIGLDATAGFNLGPVHIGVDGTASATAESQQDIAFREQLSLVSRAQLLPVVLGGDGNIAQTNLVAVPHSLSTFKLEPLSVSMTFDLDIDAFIGTIHLSWHQPFFSLPAIDLAEPDAYGGDETQRIRIGEYTDTFGVGGFDGSSQRPRTVSYLAGRVPFQAFTDTVATCLADPRPVPKPDGPPERPPTPGPAQGHICAVGPGDYDLNVGAPVLPAGICDDAAVRADFARQASETWSYNSADAERARTQKALEATYMDHVIQFVCTPTSIAVGSSSRSHMLAPLEEQTYGDLVKECTTAFTYGADSTDAAKTIGELVGSSLIPLRACADDATPLPL